MVAGLYVLSLWAANRVDCAARVGESRGAGRERVSAASWQAAQFSGKQIVRSMHESNGFETLQAPQVAESRHGKWRAGEPAVVRATEADLRFVGWANL